MPTLKVRVDPGKELLALKVELLADWSPGWGIAAVASERIDGRSAEREVIRYLIYC